jgi:hypothetical protein
MGFRRALSTPMASKLHILDYGKIYTRKEKSEWIKNLWNPR